MSTRTRAAGWFVTGAFLILCAACGQDEDGQGEVPTGVTGSFESWLAVLAVAEDPNEFGDLTQQVLEGAGVAILESPVVCIDWLPESVALPSDYVLAVFAFDRESVLAIAARTGLEPVYVGEVRQLCVD